MHHRAVLALIDGVLLEAEHIAEKADRGLRIAIAERGMSCTVRRIMPSRREQLHVLFVRKRDASNSTPGHTRIGIST